jgi:hypothetical protein
LQCDPAGWLRSADCTAAHLEATPEQSCDAGSWLFTASTC